jgi:hypothetical protein
MFTHHTPLKQTAATLVAAPSLTEFFSSMLAPASISLTTSSNCPPLAAAYSSKYVGISPACAPEGESVTQGNVAPRAEQAPFDELLEASNPTKAEPPRS